MSVTTFAPELPSGSGDTSNFIRRLATSKRLEDNRAAFQRTGFLRVDERDGAELWRISVRVAAFQDVDYGAFIDELRSTIEPAVVAHRERGRILAEIADRNGGSYGGAAVLLWSRADAQGHDMLGETLYPLLARERLRLNTTRVNPAEVPLVDLQQLREFDCVVLGSGFSAADVEMIRHAAGNVVLADEKAIAAKASAAKASGAKGGAAPAGDLLNSAPPAALERQEISAVYTGVVPIVYKAQRELLSSLIESTFWSFITITPLMMFVARSIRAGIVVMLPNLLPVLVIFGGMGWMNIAVDIGSMMTASIALGVAVDDTIHFLSWFREDLRRLGDRKQAILAAYRRCATPTLQAALISGLGLSVFAFSTFTPTQRFGWLMLTILLAGVVAELILLPALLAGPLGLVFRVPRSYAAKMRLAGDGVQHASACPPPHCQVGQTANTIRGKEPNP
jgi:hypothetical protein